MVTVDPTLIGRLCDQLDRLDARFDAHALEEARQSAELLAEIKSIKGTIEANRTDLTNHKRSHAKWERRGWALLASMAAFLGIQGWSWFSGGKS